MNEGLVWDLDGGDWYSRANGFRYNVSKIYEGDPENPHENEIWRYVIQPEFSGLYHYFNEGGSDFICKEICQSHHDTVELAISKHRQDAERLANVLERIDRSFARVQSVAMELEIEEALAAHKEVAK